MKETISDYLEVLVLRLSRKCLKELISLNINRNLRETNPLIKRARESYIESLKTSKVYLEAEIYDKLKMGEEIE